jgi:cobalt/nickel transport protein
MMSMLRSLVVAAVLLGGMGHGSVYAAEKWPGIDEAVVNRIAREHGRGEKPSLFPAAEGDLQLFLFLLAGTVGGFVAGYYWRVLLEGKNKPASNSKINPP